MRFLRLLVSLGFLLPLGMTPAAFAGPNAAAGIGLAPGHPQPGGVQYFVENVHPGQTLRDEVTVANPSPAPAQLYVNPVDGLTSTNTGAVYGNRDAPLRDAGAWVSVRAATLTVAADTRESVPFTVHVPAAALSGDHLAGLAFENVTAATHHSGALTVRTVSRSVIGILIHVSGAASKQIHLTAARLTFLPGIGSADLQIGMASTGGLLVKPLLHVDMTGPHGYSRQLSHQLDTILPGDAIQFPQPWPDALPTGRYRAAITLTAAAMPTATLAVTLPLGHPLVATTPGMRPTLTAPAGTAAGAAGLLALLAASVAIFLVGFYLIARRRHASSRNPVGRHAVARSRQPTR